MGAHGGPDIVTDDLFLLLDFSDTKCYAGGAIGTSNTVYNLVDGGSCGVSNTNGSITFSSDNNGCFVWGSPHNYNEGIDIPNTGTMGFCTLSVWVYNLSGGDARQSIFQSYWEIVGEAIQMYSYSFTTQAWRTSSGNVVPYNTWTNVVQTWDQNSDASVHINGAHNNTSTNGAGGTTQSFNTMCDRSSRSINAKIGAISVYKRVLSATEIKQNYNALRTRFGQ
jgi:hypothetical protein